MSQHFPIVISVATFRRPELLEKLLVSLKNQQGINPEEFHVVVVDNDAECSASNTVAKFSEMATYVSQPMPGIAAARNAGIDEAENHAPSALVFVDDDEVVPETWLAELLAAWRTTGADVVTGPVAYQMPPGTDQLKRAVHFFMTIEHPNLGRVSDVATNNTLVSSKWFYESPRLRFSERYSHTGGSDLELFHRLQRHGGFCVWASKARVDEVVPESRANLKWVRQRDLRNGQLQARLRMELHNEPTRNIAVLGVMRVIKGAALFVLSAPTSDRRIKAWHILEKGRGYVRASRGRLYNEYLDARKSN
ncbi:glycosyltransferase [Pseudarthrobacter phenanthrenivorans]|uniref:glycosyltransferase family 2 protein n=1 Tax=Pseudarthrobacter phenanthrenivorans TaxID=361575 RepID=UPI00344BCE28